MISPITHEDFIVISSEGSLKILQRNFSPFTQDWSTNVTHESLSISFF